jgi:tRNA threonylcarbamoyladenosine biosynthesis protein TsaE
MIVKSLSEKETMDLAKRLAKKVKAPVFICLKGGLGSGKTVFAKGFAEGLGINPLSVKSPTYTFVREYKIKSGKFYHFDFYRIEEMDDLMANTIREIFDSKNALFLIEWAENIPEMLPEKKCEILFRYIGENERELTFIK